MCTCNTLHFNMHTNILLACPPSSPSSSKFSYKHNNNIPTKGGTRDILLKYSNPSSITVSEFNTSATFEKESPPLYPSLPFNTWVVVRAVY